MPISAQWINRFKLLIRHCLGAILRPAGLPMGRPINQLSIQNTKDFYNYTCPFPRPTFSNKMIVVHVIYGNPGSPTTTVRDLREL